MSKNYLDSYNQWLNSDYLTEDDRKELLSIKDDETKRKLQTVSAIICVKFGSKFTVLIIGNIKCLILYNYTV